MIRRYEREHGVVVFDLKISVAESHVPIALLHGGSSRGNYPGPAQVTGKSL